MANPAVTYTLTNGTTADASQVTQNFTDIINSMTDGTKSLTIDALVCAGSATFQDAVTFGTGTADDVTWNSSLASSIPIKTNNSFDFGSATLGLAGVYLGAPSSRSTRVRAHQSLSASNTLVLPNGNGSAGQRLRTDGSTGTFFVNDSPALIGNYSITASVAASALTVALKDAAGADASASNPIDISFRSATVTSGLPVIRQVTGALSVVVSSGSTLGHASAVNQYVYVWALDNAGTVELAVSGRNLFDENTVQSSTGEGGAGGATSGIILYSTTARNNVAFRLLGRLKSSQAAAGTWATAIAEISLAHGLLQRTSVSEVIVTGGNASAHGSTNTKIRRFNATESSSGTAITFADSATNGGSFTINEDGFYCMTYWDRSPTAGDYFGISLNSTQLTTNIQSITAADMLTMTNTSAANNTTSLGSIVKRLRAGDVIRAHTNANPNGGTGKEAVCFIITQVLKA